MRNSFERLSGYTGGALEDELLGEIMCGWDGDRYIRLLDSGEHELAYAMINEWVEQHFSDEMFGRWRRSNDDGRKRLMMDWAREHQPIDWDPKYPHFEPGPGETIPEKYVLMGDFHDHVALKMGLEDINDLKIVTMLGTPGDQKWGIDFYLQLGEDLFTIDLTLREKRGYKADYLMRIMNPGDKSELKKEFEDHAEIVAGRFQELIARKKEAIARETARPIRRRVA